MNYAIIHDSGDIDIIAHNGDTLGATIRTAVGGPFDCINLPNVKCVMYVHDEGHILNLPVNAIATALAGRIVAGPVVIVGTHNDEGIHDGENHNITRDALAQIMWHLEVIKIRAACAIN